MHYFFRGRYPNHSSEPAPHASEQYGAMNDVKTRATTEKYNISEFNMPRRNGGRSTETPRIGRQYPDTWYLGSECALSAKPTKAQSPSMPLRSVLATRGATFPIWRGGATLIPPPVFWRSRNSSSWMRRSALVCMNPFAGLAWLRISPRDANE
jgi:hypothetical protein